MSARTPNVHKENKWNQRRCDNFEYNTVLLFSSIEARMVMLVFYSYQFLLEFFY